MSARPPERLRDVIAFLLALAGDSGIGETRLVKFVYFAELASWERFGAPLVGTEFVKFTYGAWAPEISNLADVDPVSFRRSEVEAGPYMEKRYFLRDFVDRDEISTSLSPVAMAVLSDVYERFRYASATAMGQASKETLPMQLAEFRERLDLSQVAPRTSAVKVTSSRLADAAKRLPNEQVGTDAELDRRDREELAAWNAMRRRSQTG